MNGGAWAVAAGNAEVEGPEGPGVDDRLPVSDGPPMLYDCEIFVRAKKEVAAASILNDQKSTSPLSPKVYTMYDGVRRPPVGSRV